jgi:hypothetical protein
MEKKLELRMYGLVPYNMSPIQQGIQFGHAVVDYGQSVKGLPNIEEKYNDWANNWKTFIILNGGTTNTNPERLGTLNQHAQTLLQNGVMCQKFHEPDLGDQLTAVVFIVDERVFNKELYPDYVELDIDENVSSDAREYLLNERKKLYKNWLDYIGGEKNEFLRAFLKNFRLA